MLTIELPFHLLGELLHYTPKLVVQYLGPSSPYKEWSFWKIALKGRASLE